jgi:hypothetical protein
VYFLVAFIFPYNLNPFIYKSGLHPDIPATKDPNCPFSIYYIYLAHFMIAVNFMIDLKKRDKC